ncbi:hypothetical protein [Herbaspirillum huttiense]|uniref:hypothetical protein n=1 Tax=Herbaspirillum huttiense TaxID=863372 RepID=UPI0003F80037|nr:hypothetical protein [Herbaspirillum huttiense]
MLRHVFLGDLVHLLQLMRYDTGIDSPVLLDVPSQILKMRGRMDLHVWPVYLNEAEQNKERA